MACQRNRDRSRQLKAEGASRVTWEIEQVADSCRLTVTHDRLRPDRRALMYASA